MTLELDALP